MFSRLCGVMGSAALAAACCGTAVAQTGPDYGIDFVTVGAVNNAPLTRSGSPDFPNSPSVGHGSVSYEYRIGRTEITTAQWMQFVNTFNGTTSAEAPPFFHWAGPFSWGAAPDPTYHGPGFRYVLPASNPNAAMTPVYGLSWREAALYCNWLCRGQSSDPASLLTGAYDVSTWGPGPQGTFTDAPNHLPGARFWIPTFDEQLKAFHYDPNRNGPGQGDYWLNKNMRDTTGIAGPPGVGQTSAGWVDPNVNLGELMIPLGAYPDQLSPWGLLDTSGGATEWNERVFPAVGPRGERGMFGGSAGFTSTPDSIYGVSSGTPNLLDPYVGFRIASAVPSPGAIASTLVTVWMFGLRRKRRPVRTATPLALLAAVAWASPASAQQDYGIDFVTVGAVNNPAFFGTSPPGNRWPINGSGSVPYEYRIGRTEITTAQWMQFVNTFNGTEAADAPPFFHWAGPFSWGATDDPNYGGPGFRYVLPASNPNAAMTPVYGISWREAALYSNWLHNGQSSDPASLLTGAYDVSTWGPGPQGSFTDALTHLPGARFWIPTLDEQVKAFHYDPNRNGEGQGGYWLNKNMRDTQGIAGPPGVGQTSAGWDDPNVNLGELMIPLGAYADQLSPWGLLDTSGGATEWSEQAGPQFGPAGGRYLYGASAGFSSTGDALWNSSSVGPDTLGPGYGFRIASSVPTPGTCAVVVLLGSLLVPRRKRKS